MNIQKYQTPKSLTQIPQRIYPVQKEPVTEEKPVNVTVNHQSKVIIEIPDELKLVIMIGFVAVISWMMLTVYVASFNSPRVIILDRDSQIIK
jgi:hypothetical protein